MHIMVCFFLGDGAVIIFGISPWVELTLYFGLISGSSFLMILHLYQNNDQWFIIDFYWLQKKKSSFFIIVNGMFWFHSWCMLESLEI